MMPADKDVVKDWEIPLPPELTLACGIGVDQVGDSWTLTFTGSKMQLCILASTLLRAAGVKKLEVDKVKR